MPCTPLAYSLVLLFQRVGWLLATIQFPLFDGLFGFTAVVPSAGAWNSWASSGCLSVTAFDRLGGAPVGDSRSGQHQSASAESLHRRGRLETSGSSLHRVQDWKSAGDVRTTPCSRGSSSSSSAARLRTGALNPLARAFLTSNGPGVPVGTAIRRAKGCFPGSTSPMDPTRVRF